MNGTTQSSLASKAPVAHSLLMVLALAGYASSSEATLPGVEIKQPGVLALGALGSESIYWIDERRVLFLGSKADIASPLPDGRKPLKNFLMEWDTTAGTIQTLAELGEYPTLCYDGGYVRYSFFSNQQRVVKAGSFPQLSELTPSISRVTRNRLQTNPFTCREYDEGQLKASVGVGFWPLREEHGYWGARDESRRFETLLVRVQNGVRSETVLKIPYHPPPTWSAYAGAYVFQRTDDFSDSTKRTGRIWLLRPDGRTQEFNIPAGPWFVGSTGYGLTKRGPFMYSHATGTYGNGDAGGYLVESSGQPKRFIEGYIYAFRVSADGCRVAMSIRLQPGPADRAEMAMADLCSRRK